MRTGLRIRTLCSAEVRSSFVRKNVYALSITLALGGAAGARGLQGQYTEEGGTHQSAACEHSASPGSNTSPPGFSEHNSSQSYQPCSQHGTGAALTVQLVKLIGTAGASAAHASVATASVFPKISTWGAPNGTAALSSLS